MRVKRGNVLRKRHKKILKLAKGFKGARSRIFKVANCAVMKALKYSYRDRRNLKRNMRRLYVFVFGIFLNTVTLLPNVRVTMGFVGTFNLELKF